MAKRDEFLEKYNRDERVERIVFSRGYYNIELSEKWYSLRGRRLAQNVWWVFTTMKDVESWINRAVLVEGDLKEMEEKIIELSQGYALIESWDKKMKRLEEEWSDLEKAIIDKKARIIQLKKELSI